MKYQVLGIVMLIMTTLAITPGASRAQSPKSLSLGQAVALSVTNSNQVKSNKARIAEAIAAVQEAKDRRLPDVNISGSYLRLNNPNIDLKTSKSTNGGTTPTEKSNPSVSQAVYGLANVSLPLFSGYRIQYGIESAKYLQQAIELEAGKDQEEIIQNTINAYANLYKSAAAINTVKESLNQARQRVTDFTNLEKNGLLARNDLLKAALQASNIELTLLDAESNNKIATVNMNLMLGLPEATPLVTDSGSFSEPQDNRNLEEWEQAALQNRKDLSALGFRKKAAVTGVKAVKGELYPGIALTGGYIAAHVPNLLTITNAVNLGLGVQYNLGSLWKTKSKIKQADARVQQVQAGEAALMDAIRLQVNQSYENLLLSRKKINVYLQAVEQASENYKITKNKYDNSLVTTTDLLEAEVAQLQARLNYTFARADAVVAYNKLLQTAGIIDTTNTK